MQGYERMAQALSRSGDVSGGVGVMVGLGARWGAYYCVDMLENLAWWDFAVSL